MIVGAFTGLVTFGSQSAAAATPFRSLRIGIPAWQVTTYNPMAITLTDEYIVIYNTYSTLLTNDASYQVKGDLAYSWSLAPDDVTWTFHLVHGAYFIDPSSPPNQAHPVTAADVVFSYQLQMAQTASILHAYTADLKTVTALDPYTVQIVTDKPIATMYSTAVNIPIMPQYVWSGIQNPVKSNPKYPIGSGAYYYDYTNSSGNVAVFRRNPYYYGSQYYCEVMKPNEIRYISFANSGAMVTDFTSGTSQLNAVIGVDPDLYTGNTAPLNTWTPKWAVDQGFVGEYSINAMNTTERAALVASGLTQFKTGSNSQILATNPVVRLAVAMSIDKQTLIKDALLGLGNVGDSLVPDTNPWHYTIPAQYQYQFDPAAARAMLNAAGWHYDSAGKDNPAATPLYQAGGTNGLIFRFYTLNTDPWWALAAKDIVGWLNAAGIQTTDVHGNTNPGYGAYSINQMSGYWLSADYDMWLWDWVFTPASDPSTDILEVETTQAIGPTSDNFYSNVTYDALYNQSVTTVDPVARRAILNEMQMMIYNYTSYIIPFYKDDLYAAIIGRPPTGGQGWENWGDWGTQNGLTPDSDLMNLWTHVDPIDNPAPAIASFPSITWVNGSAATIGISVNDPEAAYLNYSFNFGDGSPILNTTTVPVTHTYANVGVYNITVRVTNSEFPACGSTTATIVKAGSINLPPTAPIIQGSSSPTWYVNHSYSITATSSDPDSGDTLNFTWTWGDGTQTYCPANQAVTNCTTSGGTSTATHAFKRTTTGGAPYTVTVAVSDGHTQVNTQNPVQVTVAEPPPTYGWLVGVITDSRTGNPIQGAVVSTTPGSATSSATPADGSYNITLAPGIYNATAVAQYYTDSAPQEVTIVQNTETVLNIPLVPNVGWIAGTVTDASTSSPIANVAIAVTLTGSSQPLTSSHTDAQGKYNISVEPDSYIVNASANGYLSASETGVVVTAGNVTDVPFALEPFNLPPQILNYAPNELTAYPNVMLWFNLSAKDFEGDPLYVTWTFGDGGATEVNYTASGTQAGVILSQTHAYAAIGTYKAFVTVTDNKTAPGLNHSPQANVTVTITAVPSKPSPPPASNPLIDYGVPVAIVAVIVIAVAAVVLRRRKRMRKEEAEVAEETQENPPGSPPPP